MMYIEIASKLFFGLIALLLITRILGKKEMSQLTPFDFIYSIVLGGILEESIYDDKVNPLHVWFAVAVWGIMLYIIEKTTQKNDKIRKLLKGETSILIQDGEFNIDELNKNHLEMEQLRVMLRQQGVFSLSEVCDLFLEPGGTISLKKYGKYKEVTPDMLNLQAKNESVNFLFVDEGKINEGILEYVGKSKQWLYDSLAEEGYPNLKEVLYAEWSETNGFYIKGYSKSKENIKKVN